MGRLSFTLADNRNYCIENDKQEIIGTIERIRVGAWMTWCLLLEKDCYMSAGCLDEVRAFIKKLNACSLNLKSKNNSQHIKPESTIEADSCRPCETQKDKIVDTSHNLNNTTEKK